MQDSRRDELDAIPEAFGTLMEIILARDGTRSGGAIWLGPRRHKNAIYSILSARLDCDTLNALEAT